MKSKLIITIATVFVALILLTGTFATGVIVGRAFSPAASSMVQSFPFSQNSENNSNPNAIPQNGTPANLNDLFAPFWQSWQIVHDQYVDQPVDDEKMMQGAIQGMLQSLGDEHTSYMNPDQYGQLNRPLEGEYEGIGAWVDPSGDYLTIVSPMPGSPAEKAGIKAGDKVTAVNGKNMTGVDGNLVIRQVLGPAGTTVTLTIARPGETNTFDVVIERAHIVVPSLESKMLDGNIAYIHLLTFGDKTPDELQTALSDLMAQKPAGLILDLRNNAGGLLNTAIEVASQFVGNGVIMYEQYGDGTRQTYTALKGGLATDIPMVVLINEGSASSSEIVAGAIQDHDRGKLVGVTSYGKGSVQNWVPLKNNEGAVRVTIAHWLTPNERTINKVGLTPDIEVKLSEDDINAGKDPQLDQAIALLSQP
jgi:carboxyl-terminal processing protease